MLKNDKKKRDIILSLILAAVVLALFIYVDKEMHYSMLASIIQKAAIYSLLAVSLNLLNGFTGLFSLGNVRGLILNCPQTSSPVSHLSMRPVSLLRLCLHHCQISE